CHTPFVSIARQAKALPLRRSSSRAVRSKCNTWTRCSAPGTHLDIPCRKAGRARNEAKYNAPIGGVNQLSRNLVEPSIRGSPRAHSPPHNLRADGSCLSLSLDLPWRDYGRSDAVALAVFVGKAQFGENLRRSSEPTQGK